MLFRSEDEMVGWHHQLNGHEFEQAPGVGDGQGSLVCCSPWGGKESDTTAETGVLSLGQEDTLEEGTAPTPVPLPGESDGQRSLVGYGP